MKNNLLSLISESLVSQKLIDEKVDRLFSWGGGNDNGSEVYAQYRRNKDIVKFVGIFFESGIIIWSNSPIVVHTLDHKKNYNCDYCRSDLEWDDQLEWDRMNLM